MNDQPMGDSAQEPMMEVPERLLFECQGKFWDPVLLWRKLANHPRIDVWQEMSRIHTPLDPDDAMEGFANLVTAGRDAFSMPEVNPETGLGYTETEVFFACRDYMVWVADLKKKLPLLPTRWRRGVHSDSSAAPSADPNSGASSSTGSESSSDKQSQS